MKALSIRVMLLAAMTVGLSGAATAAGKDKPKVDMGKQEYVNSCAVCHGVDGKAQTQVMDILKVAPPNLRQLSKKNGGVFPMARVYETIDGRVDVKSHGTRDMPIWGQRYSSEATPMYDDYQFNAEVAARARILGLVDYLYRMQDK
jgi:mono/diheme cytochrome c family protein